jgi:cobalt-zinc-cadmium efflux system protein
VTRTTRLVIALGINAVLVLAQVVAGVLAHSTGLVADAGHNLTDVASIGLALLAVRWALRPRSDERSFGNHRGTILAALTNAAVLAVTTVVIVSISVVRLIHPVAVSGGVVIALAAVATVANVIAALVLHDGSHDLNLRAAALHMGADVLASLSVLVAGVVIVITGGGAWDRIDPVASLVVAALIVVQAVRLSRESVEVLLESTPDDVDLDALRTAITATPGVAEIHDLHVWSLSSDVRAMSAHLVLTGHPTLEEAQRVGGRVRARVTTPYRIAHTTFELECERCVDDDDDPCAVDGSAVPVGHGTRRNPE